MNVVQVLANNRRVCSQRAVAFVLLLSACGGHNLRVTSCSFRARRQRLGVFCSGSGQERVLERLFGRQTLVCRHPVVRIQADTTRIAKRTRFEFKQPSQERDEVRVLFVDVARQVLAARAERSAVGCFRPRRFGQVLGRELALVERR